uniref:Uncharacterized protein n=1 Tax=Anguilla anguilla TaxID=7936 RepID=A0A0E9S9L2_ANGAN
MVFHSIGQDTIYEQVSLTQEPMP